MRLICPRDVATCLAGSGGGRFVVAARDGRVLRAGPGLAFPRIRTLGAGTALTVLSFDGPHGDWARVDLNDDALIDGHVHSDFLLPAALPGDGDESVDHEPDPDEGVEEPAAAEA